MHYYLHNSKSIYSSLEFTDQNLFFYHFYEDLIFVYKNTILNKKNYYCEQNTMLKICEIYNFVTEYFTQHKKLFRNVPTLKTCETIGLPLKCT